MKLSIRTAKPLDVTADLVAAFVFSDSDKKSKERPATEVIDRAMRGALLPLLKEEEFKGKKDQIVSARTLGSAESVPGGFSGVHHGRTAIGLGEIVGH